MMTKQIYKPRPITGFPEWLPEVRLIEQRWMDHIRRVFEFYGFCSIETPSVEEIDVLRAKGEVDKEIYVIERLHKDENDNGESRLALHFDQTVPRPLCRPTFQWTGFSVQTLPDAKVWRASVHRLGVSVNSYQCDIDDRRW